jgi:hypothetical protein
LVSDAALARKQRFMDAKKEHGGSAGVINHIKTLKWNVWHDEDGSIISISKEDNLALSERYTLAQFDNEQADILIEKNWNLYRIRTDKINKHVKYIEVRPVEIEKVDSEQFFLYSVDQNSKRMHDIKVSLSSKALTVTAHKTLIAKYKDTSLEDAIIQGRKYVPMYITTPCDPSFLFKSITISLEELLNKKKVVVDLDDDYRGCSVFTLKLFDNYNFVEEKK